MLSDKVLINLIGNPFLTLTLILAPNLFEILLKLLAIHFNIVL